MPLFSKKQFFSDGWVESPLGHGKHATSNDKESEYFMQWIHPIKFHRIAMRTPMGYRLTHGLGTDIFNNNIGIKIEDQPELSSGINKKLTKYLKSRKWLKEMKKWTGFLYEQGEACLYLHFDEDVNANTIQEIAEQPIDLKEEILEVEAINLMDYKILTWDDFGEPEMYSVNLHLGRKGTQGVRVHGSRMLRFTMHELYQKGYGYPRLGVVYDSIVIYTNIVKASGEAAFRWGTGHPLILTKDILEDDEIAKVKSAIGNPTRRSWHVLPSEWIESFEMKGQAGQMLNLKALSDIALESIIVGSKVPKGVVMGEAQVTAGVTEDRGFYGLLDELQSEISPFIELYFERDINIQKIIHLLPDWTIDWGIRHVLNKMDQMEYDQRKYSNALALTTICTVNECRKVAGFPPLEGPEGELIIGIDQMMMQMEMMSGGMGGEVGGGQADEAIAMGQKDKSTTAKSKTSKDLNKDKTISKNKLRENKKKVSDAITELREIHSMKELTNMTGLSKQTLYKLERWKDES